MILLCDYAKLPPWGPARHPGMRRSGASHPDPANATGHPAIRFLLARHNWLSSSQLPHGDRLGDAQSDRDLALAEPVQLQLADRLVGDRDG
jgi:hypothetical protein